MDMNLIKWSKSSKVKLISVFTDNPFHVEGDTEDEGTVPAPLHAWSNPEPTYRYHNPESILRLSDQLDGNVPFSLDFYITNSRYSMDNVLDQYAQFTKSYSKKSHWFVLRKTAESSSIVKSFEEKTNNLEFIIDQANTISEMFNEKCDVKITPEDDKECTAILGTCTTDTDQCSGTIVAGKCGGSQARQCCVPVDCSLIVYENTNVTGLH